MLEAAILGLVAGILHVATGPDHLAAIAPLAGSRGAWVRGFLWGVGHSSGVFAVGIVALVARELVPIELMSDFGNRLAAGALILVGLWTLFRWWRPPSVSQQTGLTGIELRAAGGFGILHGLAGSSHYLGLAPALGFGQTLSSCIYLAFFGLATIATMVIAAEGISRGARSLGRVDRVAPASGLAAIAVGIVWLSGWAA